jgi:hypothetical protein
LAEAGVGIFEFSAEKGADQSPKLTKFQNVTVVSFYFPFLICSSILPQKNFLAPSSLRARSSLRRSSLGSAKKFVADLAIYRDLSQAPIYRSEIEQVPVTVQGRRSVLVCTKCHQARKPETE